MRYLIGSGFVDGPGRREFAEIWADNFYQHNPPDGCTRIVILGVGGAIRPIQTVGYKVEWIGLDGNCGHIGDLISGQKDRALCGWTSAVCALAMIAYCDESDFIYREQDCLCFGPWVERLYADMGDGYMAFGGPMKSAPFMECGQSLFIVKNSFIPHFVMSMIDMGDERQKDCDGKENNLPERKFHKLRESFTDKIKTLSFGVDRERPLPIDNTVWYAQHLSSEEIYGLKKLGLL